jgi:hypothetical protein
MKSIAAISLLALLSGVGACSLLGPEDYEGPIPSKSNLIRQSVIIGPVYRPLAMPTAAGQTLEPVGDSLVFLTMNQKYPPDNVNFLIGLRPFYRNPGTFTASWKGGFTFKRGDTLLVTTEAIPWANSVWFQIMNPFRDSIPEYNPNNKNWIVAWHTIKDVHSINGVPVE